jgi:hypothetical protein
MITDAFNLPDPRGMDPVMWSDQFLEVSQIQYQRMTDWREWAQGLSQADEMADYNVPDPGIDFEAWAIELVSVLQQ